MMENGEEVGEKEERKKMIGNREMVLVVKLVI